ncbi:hypothetical protein L2E82_17367 [Cichorium intybus]|uniref:Uncharacterized protein n=1 Tax=Cichorium intybus TaxID=13427 RepID=A0ACB9F8M0_CICIN|nr:hypothetical protein L2E82_17367 [Cichorium intybus]
MLFSTKTEPVKKLPGGNVKKSEKEGKVHFTEIQDSWVPNPLSNYHEGQFVKCKVLDISHSGTGTVHVDLSLRSNV